MSFRPSQKLRDSSNQQSQRQINTPNLRPLMVYEEEESGSSLCDSENEEITIEEVEFPEQSLRRTAMCRAAQNDLLSYSGEPMFLPKEPTHSNKHIDNTAKPHGGVSIFSVWATFRVVKTALLALWIVLTLLTLLFFLNEGRSEPTLPGSGSENQLRNEKKHLKAGKEPFVDVPSVPFFLRARRHIPLPLPPDKVSVVLMNYSRPRMIRESTLMRTLLSHPNVDEVVLLHSNPSTAFEFVHPKVVNIDATRQNDEMGLSLRFYFCQLVKNPWVIHVDDDMEFTSDTLSEVLIEFGKNNHRIVGRFGRNLVERNSFNGYSSADTHKESEVILTKFMIMERRVCSSFFEYAGTVYNDVVLNNGEGPLWNGEDIFMSLVANHVYGNDNNNYAMDWLDVWAAPDHLKDYDHGTLDICGGMSWYRFWDWQSWQSILRRNRHYSYRGLLWHTAKEKLRELRLSE